MNKLDEKLKRLANRARLEYEGVERVRGAFCVSFRVPGSSLPVEYLRVPLAEAERCADADLCVLCGKKEAGPLEHGWTPRKNGRGKTCST